jgi:hypothetical protein
MGTFLLSMNGSNFGNFYFENVVLEIVDLDD